MIAAGALTACGGPVQATLPEGYVELDRFEKQRIIWEDNILPTEYDGLPSEVEQTGGAAWGVGATARTMTDLETTTTHESDEAPAGRYKMIHTVGVVGKVELVMDASDDTPLFTGLLARCEGENIGLARLSLAAPPSTLGFTPAMGLKFLVDGHASGDLVAMHDVQGRDDHNFFARDMYTDIPTAPEDVAYLVALEDQFETVAIDGDASRIDLSHLAKRCSNGREIDRDFRFAANALRFVPTQAVATAIPSDSEADFRDDLMEKIEVDTALFHVEGRVSVDGDWKPIGELVLRSRLVASSWGDTHLWFRHR